MLKVSELTGAQLDYWAARAEGVPAEQLEIREIQRSAPPAYHCVRLVNHQDDVIGPDALLLSPSTLWVQGGPIIHENNIALSPPTSPVHRCGGPNAGPGESKVWTATTWERGANGKRSFGMDDASPLVAAMRCYVRHIFGEEVPECGN